MTANNDRDYSKIPAELKALPNWINYRLAPRSGGGLNKLPVNPYTGEWAKGWNTDPSTWASFDKAVSALADFHMDGICFVFSPDCDCIGLDLDHVLVDGRLKDDYRWVVDEGGTYTEISPSGDGLHLIFRGSKPDGATVEKKGPAEMYDGRSSRYLTFTGNVFEGHGTIRENPQVVARAYKTWLDPSFGEPKQERLQVERDGTEKSISTEKKSAASPDEVLGRMRRSANWDTTIRPLFEDGDTSANRGDDSAADLALCDCLAFYSDNDAATMDALFRKSALYRPKWDEMRGEKTYGEITIGKAIADTHETPRDWKKKQIAGLEDGKADQPGKAATQAVITAIAGKVIRPTVGEIVQMLESDPEVSRSFGFNELERAVFVTGPTPWDALGEPRRFSDVDLACLYAHVQRWNRKASKGDVTDALNIVANRRHFNPVVDELRGLGEKQRGLDYARHLPNWLLGAEDGRYEQQVMLAWMREAVARAFRPGIVAPWMPVLHGPQGCGKSRFCSLMALDDAWYTDSTSNLTDIKGTAESLNGRWIAEIGEMSAMRGKDLEAVKATITRTDDVFRDSYGRFASSHPRCSVFVGTTNRADFLRDRTGNRRFYPIHVAVCKPKYDIRDTDAIMPVIREAWGEVVAEYMAASKKADTEAEFLRLFPIEPPEDVRQTADAVREEFTEANDNAEAIAYWLKGGGYPRVCAPQVAEGALSIDRTDYAKNKRLQHEVNEIMDTLPGWKRSPNKQRIEGYGIRRCWVPDL